MQPKQEYVWSNRESFPGHIQHLADPLQSAAPPEELGAVKRLFQRVLERSEAALLIFNDKTRQMELYDIPRTPLHLQATGDFLLAKQDYSDSRSYFEYHAVAFHLFGGQGSEIELGATRTNKSFLYGLEFARGFRERLDDQTCCNVDKMLLTWELPSNRLYDKLQAKLGRESRANYLDLWGGLQPGKRVFPADPEAHNLLKHSNLFSFQLQTKKGPFSMFLRAGWDHGNASTLFAYGGQLHKGYQVGGFEVGLSAEGAHVVGRNLLKNDLAFRNCRRWVGRSSNFLSARTELAFKQYPYLSFLGLKPYLYTQAWTVLRRQEGRPAAKLELEYGIGIATAQSKFDLTLLMLSGDKVAGRPFGELKFSF